MGNGAMAKMYTSVVGPMMVSGRELVLEKETKYNRLGHKRCHGDDDWEISRVVR